MGAESPARGERSAPAAAESRDDGSLLDVVEPAVVPDGVDAACWAHIVCPECGSVLSEGHRRGCSHSAES